MADLSSGWRAISPPPTAPKKVIDGISKEGHELDILVLNAGKYGVVLFEEVDDAMWLDYFQTNVMSSVRLARHFLPLMLKRPKEHSRIIVISSEASMKPLETMIHYSVTKGAQITFARGMAELTKGTAVTVNSVLPGPTATEGLIEYFDGIAKAKGISREEVAAQYFKEQEPDSLLQRPISPEEVAATVTFLASPLAAAINGTAQRCDGGAWKSVT